MFLENGTAYIVMEYLEGETLEARLERTGSLPPDEVQGLAEALCEALAEVHDDNWLHRDIKPSNIVLTADQRVVLIDFGSAREFHLHRTQRHTRILTAQYAAPEQYSEEARFGPYTDAFSLGATLYHALTGAPPPSAMDRFQSGRDLDFPPGVPSRLATALQQTLALRVDDRPSSMAALLALTQEPTPTATGTGPSSPSVPDAPVWISPASSPESDRATLSDRAALAVFPFPYPPDGWFSDAPLAHWKGVTVDDVGRVIALQIDGYYTLYSLPSEIGQLTRLQRLDLSGNALWTLPSEIGQLTQLQSLDLSHSGLRTLPAEIGQLTQLQSLDLSHNGLRTLPSEIGQLTQLQYLDLHEFKNRVNFDRCWLCALQYIQYHHSDDLLCANELETLPSEIGQLTRLQHLELGGNRLQTLPAEIGCLTRLQHLGLGGNRLETLPAEIGQLTRLQRLELGGNQLETLPAEIGCLTQLQYLDLSGAPYEENWLEVLPISIGQLTQLQHLDLSGTRLEALSRLQWSS